MLEPLRLAQSAPRTSGDPPPRRSIHRPALGAQYRGAPSPRGPRPCGNRVQESRFPSGGRDAYQTGIGLALPTGSGPASRRDRRDDPSGMRSAGGDRRTDPADRGREAERPEADQAARGGCTRQGIPQASRAEGEVCAPPGLRASFWRVPKSRDEAGGLLKIGPPAVSSMRHQNACPTADRRVKVISRHRRPSVRRRLPVFETGKGRSVGRSRSPKADGRRPGSLSHRAQKPDPLRGLL